MDHFQVARLKLNNNYEIVNYNSHFNKLFNPNSTSMTMISANTHISNILKSSEINIVDILKTLQNESSVSYIYFKNISIHDRTHSGLLLIYVKVSRIHDEYYFEMVNWIAWLQHIHKSLENGYLCISEFNNNKYSKNFRTISDIYCLKALHPLLSHIPSQYFEFINQNSLYNVMRSFIKLRKNKIVRENKRPKDFARNVYSRIHTSIKEEFGILHYNYSLGVFLDKSVVDCI